MSLSPRELRQAEIAKKRHAQGEESKPGTGPITQDGVTGETHPATNPDPDKGRRDDDKNPNDIPPFDNGDMDDNDRRVDAVDVNRRS